MDSRQYRAKLSLFEIESVSTRVWARTKEYELPLEVVEINFDYINQIYQNL